MAPRKQKGTTAPTRRSGRLASKEPSAERDTPVAQAAVEQAPVEPASVEQEASVEKASVEQDTGLLLPSPSHSLPAYPAVIDTRALDSKQTNVSQEHAWDVNDAIRAIVRQGRRDIISLLTSEQRKAVIEGITTQNRDLITQVKELQESNAVLTGERNAALDRYRSRTSLRFAHTFGAYAPGAAPPSPPRQETADATASDAASSSPPATPKEVQLDAGGMTPLSEPESTMEAPPSPPSAPPPSAPPGESSWRKLVGYIASPFARKRKADDDGDHTTSHKRTRSETPERAAQTTRRPEPARDYSGPSSKNPRMPTSLSTITEYTEPSLLSNFSESTPSKPPRRSLSTPSAPSHELEITGSLKIPDYTPSFLNAPQSTPITLRRSTMLRAARGKLYGTPRSSMYGGPPPKPLESNADIRHEKYERFRKLQKELKELEEDKDIKEIQSHRSKRVKIDNLVSIPHNRPGDSEGTFRVPDYDSDDEMEVGEDVVERSNVFEESEQMQVEVQVEEEMQEPAFVFPEVGRIPEGYKVSEAYAAEAGRLFEIGLQAFIATY